MITIKPFIFNPFQENTYVLSDETKECIIVDAGCSNAHEIRQLTDYIKSKELIPVKLFNTHGHIDHILGLAALSELYDLVPEIHEDEKNLTEQAHNQALMFGLSVSSFPTKYHFFSNGYVLTFGNATIELLHVPGHSRGSIALYSVSDRFVISGDVLFQNSIGRADLPGGDYNTLMNSIQAKLLVLDDEVLVFPGHGPFTTIGQERKHNPFLANL